MDRGKPLKQKVEERKEEENQRGKEADQCPPWNLRGSNKKKERDLPKEGGSLSRSLGKLSYKKGGPIFP